MGPHVVQAAIAACHARARFRRRHGLGVDRRSVRPSRGAHPNSVVEVNRAVAHGRAFGSEAGPAVLHRLPSGALGSSHLLPAVRGDLLARAGRTREAATAFREAASRTRNESERTLLLRRAEQAGDREPLGEAEAAESLVEEAARAPVSTPGEFGGGRGHGIRWLRDAR